MSSTMADERLATHLAINAVEGAANPEWKRLAYEALCNAALTHEFFSVDVVWREFERLGTTETTDDNRAMGGIIRQGKRDGLLVATERYEASEREGCHGHPRRIWQSCVFVAPLRNFEATP